MKKRISLFKLIVGLFLLYYGLKVLKLLPNDLIDSVEHLIGGLLGNIWGILLVFIGIMLLLGSVYSRSCITSRYYRNWGTFSNENEDEK